MIPALPRSPPSVFFFNHTPTTYIYTLSLHDALPIYHLRLVPGRQDRLIGLSPRTRVCVDRKSTRLNSSHITISYAVFCLKKKNATGGYRALGGSGENHLHRQRLRLFRNLRPSDPGTA